MAGEGKRQFVTKLFALYVFLAIPTHHVKDSNATWAINFIGKSYDKLLYTNVIIVPVHPAQRGIITGCVRKMRKHLPITADFYKPFHLSFIFQRATNFPATCRPVPPSP